MAGTRTEIVSPTGRLVMGSLYKGSTTDAEGKPLVYKTGAQKDQPRVNYFFALAIPKGPEKGWWETSWGQKILAVGAAEFPQMYQNPAFAWKIEDGDSTVPNKKNRKACDNEGWPGNWILKFQGSRAPKVFKLEANNTLTQVMEEDFAKPGHYAEVYFSVDGNDSSQNPGIYLNHQYVCWRAFGTEINFGVDPNSVGFGQGQLPAGASAAPVASANPIAPAAPVAPQNAPVAGSPSLTASVQTPVTPNPQFLQMPAPSVSAPTAAAPSAPAAPPPPSVTTISPSSGPKMTAAAGVVTYEAYKASGWTDEQLVANGLMTL